MIRVRAFRDTDVEMLRDWRKGQKVRERAKPDITNTGFVVEWYEDAGCAPIVPIPVMCAFLVLTNADFALMEAVCASPESSPKDRELAVGALTEALSAAARELGFKRLLAFSDKERLVEKGVAAGWQVDDHKYFGCVKELY